MKKSRVKQSNDTKKQKAIAAVIDKGMPITNAAKKYGFVRQTLSVWVKEAAIVKMKSATKGIINVKPKRLQPTLPEKETWQHPNGDKFVIKWKDVKFGEVPELKFDPINKPAHYADSKIEVIDYIEDKKLNYHLGNVIKYVSRAGRKTPDALPDLKKARWYLNREISNLEKKSLYVTGLDAYNADKKTE